MLPAVSKLQNSALCSRDVLNVSRDLSKQIFLLKVYRSFSCDGAMCFQNTRVWGRARVP